MMEITDELILVVLSFACGVATAWMCLAFRMNEINAENDFLLHRKDEAEECWDAVRNYIYGLKEVDYGRGSVVGGYFSRYDLDGYKEKIREMDILMADKWRLGP